MKISKTAEDCWKDLSRGSDFYGCHVGKDTTKKNALVRIQQAINESVEEGPTPEQCDNCKWLIYAQEKDTEIEKLKSILQDVADSRYAKYVGMTGGGNPVLMYNQDKIEEALSGLGPNSIKLKKTYHKGDK